MKTKVFAVRNAREILRDPLSYVFALGFPVVMLVIMTIVNGSIPAEAGMKIFSLQNLAPAVVIFGYAFVMLFSAILSSNLETPYGKNTTSFFSPKVFNFFSKSSSSKIISEIHR